MDLPYSPGPALSDVRLKPRTQHGQVVPIPTRDDGLATAGSFLPPQGDKTFREQRASVWRGTVLPTHVPHTSPRRPSMPAHRFPSIPGVVSARDSLVCFASRLWWIHRHGALYTATSMPTYAHANPLLVPREEESLGHGVGPLEMPPGCHLLTSSSS